MLQLLCEEQVDDDSIRSYFGELYKVVCVGERPSSLDDSGGAVRTTYVVDWEQLVHLLENCTLLDEDIVGVTPVHGEEARVLRATFSGHMKIVRA